MRRKILAIMTVVIVVAALVGGSTIAWLTDRETVENNMFTTGTLRIDTGDPVNMPFEVPPYLAPGDVITGQVKAVNVGTLDFQFYAVVTGQSFDGPAGEGVDIAEMLDVVLNVYINGEPGDPGATPYATYDDLTLSELLGMHLVFDDDQVFQPGNYALYDFEITFRKDADNRYQGASWEGEITFYAFQKIPALTVVRVGNGEIDPDVGKYNFPIGSEVTLTAGEPGVGYEFLRWEVNGDVFDSGVITITLVEPVTATAHFGVKSYGIQADVNPPGSGNVTGTGTYAHFETANLKALPAVGYDFVNWTEGDVQVHDVAEYTFEVTGPRSLVANFLLRSYLVKVGASPTAGGTVSGGGTYDHGQSVTVVASPDTGYNFTNWTEGGSIVSTDASYTFTATSSRDLVANFALKQYTVAVSAVPTDGGEVTGGGTYEHGSSVTVEAKADVDAGYKFVNWTEGATEVSTSSNYNFTATGDRDLVANFQLKSYTVTFRDHDGTVLKAETVQHGSAATAPDEPLRVGYTFDGWDTDFTNVTSDLTVTALYTINQYTITFDSAGGSAVDPITQDYGTAITAPANPTKEGHTFTGWNPAVPATMPAENLTLTAQWTVNQYTITFDSASGSAVDPITQDYGTAIIAPANPTKVGHTFTGWNPAVPATMPAENLTLTAQWTVNQYTITFDSAGGSVVDAITQDYGTAITAPADPTKVGHTFTGWNPAVPATMPAHDMTLTAQWEIKKYTVIVNVNDVAFGSAMVNGSGSKVFEHGQEATITTTPNHGFHFVQWTEGDAVVEGAGAVHTFTVTSDRNLVAEFARNEYTVTVSANPTDGGTVSLRGDPYYGLQMTVTAVAGTGYDFVKWTKDGAYASGNEEYTFTVADDHALVAHFEKKTYTVTATVLDGQQTFGTATVVTDPPYRHGDSVTIRAEAFAGHDFVRWTDGEGVVEGAQAEHTFLVTSDRHFVAEFAKVSHTLTVDVVGEGTTVPAKGTHTYTYGTPVSLSATADEGWEFEKWVITGQDDVLVPETTVTMDTDRTATAHFVQRQSFQDLANGVYVYVPNTGGTNVLFQKIGTNWALLRVNDTPDTRQGDASTRGNNFYAGFPWATSSRLLTRSEAEELASGIRTNSQRWWTSTMQSNRRYFIEVTGNTSYTTSSSSIRGVRPSITLLPGLYVTGGSGTQADPYTLAMTTYTVQVAANPAEYGSITGGGVYQYGSKATVIATANPGHAFVNWTEDAVPVSAEAEYTFTVTGPRSLVANFCGEEVFNANGTWVVPTGVTSITVEAWGGGGAGGGSTGGNYTRGGAGGGGGAYASSTLTVTPGQTLQIVVAGQASGVTGRTGNNGGPSFVGPNTNPDNAFVCAAGGSGGTGNTSGGTPAGGAGGTVAASIGATRKAGVNGSSGATGSGISSGAGGAGAEGGAGGTSITSGTDNGNPGSAPGGGGSGARTSRNGSNRTGGAGAAGQVRITYSPLE